MKTKIKNTIHIVAVTAMTLPGVALAQWGTGMSNAESSGTPKGTIWNIIKNTMNWGLGILGFIAIIGFVISGILYLTAAGNQTRIDQAKSAALYSILGVIVALLGYVIVQAVNSWLGGSNTQF